MTFPHLGRQSLMKKRIQIDGAMMALAFLLTIIVCQFHYLYAPSRYIDNFMDFLGFMFILNGIYVRMAARGHKKAYSSRGKDLVKTGPYSLIRNPMYLGTFLMGAGFMLILWPWWALPLFAILFYMRFQIQIEKEEQHLRSLFGQDFDTYLQEVPPIFPRFAKLRKIRVREAFPWHEAWSTKEKRGLFIWPIVAVIVEMLKEKFVFGHLNVAETLMMFVLAVGLFTVGLWLEYKRS